ncbi:retroviral-like aspartic protease family protein [Desertifilum sp. FACHB-1129]|uniref:Aspartyl protease n=1 Tax=Desertifilum tharense IPPAS B-1220 TaxID=1781255 RepID=A0A1E5QKF3_9CYAN|nr:MULTISPECIES: retropepsin-like aspartic protease [Desertifilum]MDA0209762.1 retropepsin-like aspartic protease [Cyanobacteria bacterium FC1]MBD2310747.1 retroviral-like aspartic protease family protein [Desertifilum sp. FACHB-1129]MBD2320784.1 retroviral-like aspartic protease family protein [Desertifilum sp. FACHB-866]MBD2330912.1 retroviral-like aspartic protease family protein [Desertifilum sp. FACHB-868]OEJ75165.1 hypothetical protein BH720_10575 [Desertifilum tharense IPPAS B-1220]
MANYSVPPSILRVLLVALTFLSAACRETTSVDSQSKAYHTDPGADLLQPAPAPPPQPTPTPSTWEFYQQALDKAYSAASIAQSARSRSDWELVESRWQQAIAILQSLPADSPQHAVAQAKISEYQRNLNYAQQQANSAASKSPPVGVVTAIPTYSEEPVTLSATPPETNVFRVPIKRRVGRTPVIEVTFNNQRSFEMIVDTGASGILITQQMANDLNIVPVGIAKANTASARGVEFAVGMMDSISVNGMVAKNVPVAIAGSQLDVGLLGHEFFGDYDLTIRQDAIEFEIR